MAEFYCACAVPRLVNKLTASHVNALHDHWHTYDWERLEMNRATRHEWDGFTHFIAIDFGTYGCGMAVSTSIDPDNIHIYSKWAQNKMLLKCPTALLLNDEGEFEEFGNLALEKYQSKRRLRRPDKESQYYFFYRFKMSLYNKVSVNNMIYT